MPRARRAGRAPVVLGVAGLVLVLLVCVGVIVVMTFSATVSGHSMEPTLHDGDRLFVNGWHRDQVHRFDVVEARVETVEGGLENVVKRVIGLPGDTVSVVLLDGRPQVRVRPAGGHTTYVVVSPTWPKTATAKLDPCCTVKGRRTPEPATVVVPAGEYWLIGDNWGGSDDSRTYGFVRASAVGGTMNVRLLPLSRRGPVGNRGRLVPLAPR